MHSALVLLLHTSLLRKTNNNITNKQLSIITFDFVHIFISPNSASLLFSCVPSHLLMLPVMDTELELLRPQDIPVVYRVAAVASLI